MIKIQFSIYLKTYRKKYNLILNNFKQNWPRQQDKRSLMPCEPWKLSTSKNNKFNNYSNLYSRSKQVMQQNFESYSFMKNLLFSKTQMCILILHNDGIKKNIIDHKVFYGILTHWILEVMQMRKSLHKWNQKRRVPPISM